MIRKAKKEDGNRIGKLLSTFGDEIYTSTGATINTDTRLIEKIFNENLESAFRAFVYE